MITSRDNATLKLVRSSSGSASIDETGLFAVEGEDLVDAARVAGVEPVHLLVAGESAGASSSPACRRCRTPRARSACTGARTSRRRCATPVSRSGGSPTRETSARSSAPRMRSARRRPLRLAAPTSCRRRRCARRRGDLPRRSSRGRRARTEGRPRGPRGASLSGSGSRRRSPSSSAPSARGSRPTSHRAFTITIPLPGEAESLNVAAAGAIALYEHARRGHPPG